MNADAAASISSPEFVWENAECTAVHSIVLPIINRVLGSTSKAVLDIGCGNGAASHLLAQSGHSVVGIDASSSGIALARANYPTIDFKLADISVPLQSELQQRFDFAVSIEVIEHLFRPRDLLLRARESLLPGGRIIITTPYHGYFKNVAIALTGKFDDHVHPLRDYGHIKFFSEKTLRELINECGLRTERIIRVGRIPLLAKSMVAVAAAK